MWPVKAAAEEWPADLLSILPRSKRTFQAPPYSFLCLSIIPCIFQNLYDQFLLTSCWLCSRDPSWPLLTQSRSVTVWSNILKYVCVYSCVCVCIHVCVHSCYSAYMVIIGQCHEISSLHLFMASKDQTRVSRLAQQASLPNESSQWPKFTGFLNALQGGLKAARAHQRPVPVCHAIKLRLFLKDNGAVSMALHCNLKHCEGWTSRGEPRPSEKFRHWHWHHVGNRFQQWGRKQHRISPEISDRRSCGNRAGLRKNQIGWLVGAAPKLYGHEQL